MHNSLGSPRRPVLWTYWPETCAQRECVCKRKRLRDVRSYAICDFHRGPHAVRGLLLASDAGGSGGTARFRAGAGRCRRGKRPGQWTRLSDPAHLAPRNSRAEFRKRQTALRSPLLSPCRRHWHPGGYSHAGHCGVERARSRRLRALCGGTSRSPPASKSRDGRLSSLLLSGYSRSKFPLNTVTDAFGKVNVSPLLAFSVEVAGGPSGSAWLLAPSGCQTYCSAPNVTTVTGPAKCCNLVLLASPNSILTGCAFDGSLLISISDHSPFGFFAA